MSCFVGYLVGGVVLALDVGHGLDQASGGHQRALFAVLELADHPALELPAQAGSLVVVEAVRTVSRAS